MTWITCFRTLSPITQFCSNLYLNVRYNIKKLWKIFILLNHSCTNNKYCITEHYIVLKFTVIVSVSHFYGNIYWREGGGLLQLRRKLTLLQFFNLGWWIILLLSIYCFAFTVFYNAWLYMLGPYTHIIRSIIINRSKYMPQT